MSRTFYTSLLRIAPVAGLIAWVTLPALGQNAPANTDWRSYGGNLANHRYAAARSDQRRQFQEPRNRLAVQDREPRPAQGVSVRVDAADRQGRDVLDRRHAARRRRDRRGHRRDAVDAQRKRGPARPERAAAAVRTRARVLDRWPGRADSLRHARLPSGRARREDRQQDRRVRQGRHRRPEDGRRPGHRSRHRRGRAPRHADDRQRRRRDRRRPSSRRRAAGKDEREGIHPRVRCPDRQAAVDFPHDPEPRRIRQRDVGEGLVEVHRQYRRVGPGRQSTRSSISPTSRSSLPPATTTAARDRARTCSARRWLRST